MKESTVLIAGTKQGEYAAKDPNSPDRFQRRVFKGKFGGEGCRLHGQLMDFQWSAVRKQSDVSVMSIINLLVPTRLCACVQHVVSILHMGWQCGGCLSSCRTTQQCALDCYISLKEELELFYHQTIAKANITCLA